MTSYVAKRLLLFVPLVAGIVVVTFLLLDLLPGDPALALLGQDATPEMLEDLRERLDLDDPWPSRLASYGAGLLRGDLGESLFQNQSVVSAIGLRLGATLEIAFSALLVSILLGVSLGVLAALRPGGAVDAAVRVFALVGVSVPVFWLGILLMLLLAVQANVLPAIGRGPPLHLALGAALGGRPGPLLDSLSHLAMPALTLGIHGGAVLSRLVRSAMVETLGQDFVRTARAKGLGAPAVILGHALRNALLPVVSVVGLQFGALLGGAVLTEGIFGWPGLGQLTVSAIAQRDIPLVQGIVLTFAVMFATVNLVVDLLYAGIDPRVGLES